MFSNKYKILAAILILTTSFVLAGFLSNQKAPLQKKRQSKSSSETPLHVVHNNPVSHRIKTSGPLTAFHKIDIYAEVSGVLLNGGTPFREGMAFKKNDTLLRIESSVYKNSLLAQKSNLLNQLTLLLPDLKIDFPQNAEKWHHYLKDFELTKPLAPLPENGNEQEKYFIASRNIFSLFYTIRSMEETLKKYTLVAPYNGFVTETNIKPGALVRNGQKLGTFTNTSLFECELTIPVKYVQHLNPGDTVRLSSDALTSAFKGKIVRINKSIDNASQEVKIFVQTQNPLLKDGMYMKAEIRIDSPELAAEIPRTAVQKQNQVFVLKGNRLQRTTIHVIEDKNDSVLVAGLEDNTRIVKNIDHNIYDGMSLNNDSKKEQD